MSLTLTYIHIFLELCMIEFFLKNEISIRPFILKGAVGEQFFITNLWSICGKKYSPIWDKNVPICSLLSIFLEWGLVQIYHIINYGDFKKYGATSKFSIIKIFYFINTALIIRPFLYWWANNFFLQNCLFLKFLEHRSKSEKFR